MKMTSSPDFPLLDLLVGLILVQLFTPCSAQFSVIGPPEPILAMVGEDTDLSCHLSPKMSAETMELKWVRSSLREVVYEYVNGKEVKDQQMAEYRGRTSILRDGIPEGKATLRIYDVKISDSGSYQCYFQDGNFSEQATAELKVADPLQKARPWILALAGTVPVLLLPIAVMAYFLWRQQKEKEKEQAEKDLQRRAREALQHELKWRKIQYMARGGKSQAYAEWKTALFQAADVTLDRDTANPILLVSEDQRSLRWAEEQQNLPDNSKRFDTHYCVLGCSSFTSGRHFWEVDVGDRKKWYVGVCTDDVERKERVCIAPENGFWMMGLSDGNECLALTDPRTSLGIDNPPKRVGVFLEYETGEVSFYNAMDGSHIYTFPQTSFSGPLYPVFRIKKWDDTALTIRPPVT
ncbi:butyrophilin subfamily 3 member A3-like isoform X2 [Equus caballus]